MIQKRIQIIDTESNLSNNYNLLITVEDTTQIDQNSMVMFRLTFSKLKLSHIHNLVIDFNQDLFDLSREYTMNIHVSKNDFDTINKDDYINMESYYLFDSDNFDIMLKKVT